MTSRRPLHPPKRNEDRRDPVTLYSPGVHRRQEAEAERDRILRRLEHEDLPEPPEAA